LYLSAAVVLILALPLASLVLPSWNIGILTNPFVSVQEETASIPTEIVDSENAFSAEDPSSISGTDSRQAGTGSSFAGGRYRTGSFIWILLIWGAGGLILLLRLFGGKLYGSFIAGRAPVVEDENILAAVRRVSDQLGIVRDIPVVESDHFKVPFVSGLFRHCLVIPPRARSWSSKRMEAVLHHEFAHIRRKDILIQLLAQIACCIYWINPLAWVIERKLFIERERACDDVAINKNIKASEYAGYMMEVMEEIGGRRSCVWVMSAMAEGTDFKDRIISVLDPVAERNTPRLRHSAVVIAFSILLLFPFSSLHPWANDRATAEHDLQQITTSDGRSSRGGERLAERPAGETVFEKTDNERQFEALIALLESPEAYWREHAATALGKPGNTKAVPALITVLDDKAGSVREHVATALGRIGDRRALPYLIDVLRSDHDARVREHAASAIGSIGSDPAYEELVRAYHEDRDIGVRAHAAYGLGLMRDDRAIDLLIDGLGSRHAEIRSHCAEALGLTGDRRAVKHLRGVLRDPSDRVRESADRALRILEGK
jgi:beta-lactamase regulating signal transducer with metallopeptidase domain